MRIGSQLQLLSGMSLALVSLVMLSLAWAGVQIHRTQQHADYIEQVLPLVQELETHLRFYSHNNKTTSPDLWASAHQKLLNELKSAPRLPGEQQILLNSVISNSKGLSVLFGHLQDRRSLATGVASEQVVLQHLTDRLLVQMETIREDAVRMAGLARDNLSDTLVDQLIGVVVLVGLASLGFMLLSLRITGSLDLAIGELRTAVASVSSGHLDTVVREPVVNELGDIARGFNHMTRQLSDTMINRDRLQAIVDERTAALQDLANRDHLTGVANRRLLFERGVQEFARAGRHQTSMSLVMLDCDYFKQVNDRFGHHVGDMALQHLSKLCLQEIRGEDLFARYGGEEFVLLLPDADQDGAYQMAERIRNKVKHTPLTVDDRQVSLSVSCGVATLAPGIASFDQLLNMADAALLQAKADGRDRTEIARAA